MATYSTAVGILESFQPEKDNPEKGVLSLTTPDKARKDFKYRRFSPDALQLHVGAHTSFNVVDGVITGLLFR